MSKATLGEQLVNIIPFIGQPEPKEKPRQQVMKKRKPASNRLPHPSDWQEDGVDHINVSPIGLTDLGRTLHPNALLGFTHDVFGQFASISCFWDFIETGAKDDRIRSMVTVERIMYLKRHKKYKVEFLMFFVLDAMWQRIKTYARLSDSIKSSDLPFDVYYLNGEFNYPVRRPGSTWMIRGYEDIRNALQNDTQPDFVGLMGGFTREQLFNNYMNEHVRNRAPQAQKARGESNELLKELQSSHEAPKAFRRKIRPIIPAQHNKPPEAELTTMKAFDKEQAVLNGDLETSQLGDFPTPQEHPGQNDDVVATPTEDSLPLVEPEASKEEEDTSSPTTDV